MNKLLKDFEAGDTVLCGGDSGFCHESLEEVVKTKVRYDKKTGEPYKVIVLSGGREFDSRDGLAMNPPLAYYILPKEKK